MGLLGIDVGTSGCKATVVGLDGSSKAQAYQEYSFHAPLPGWQELDSGHVWECVKSVMKRAASEYRGDPIRAVSVSSFGEALTGLDNAGRILSNGIAYTDPRGGEEVRMLAGKLGAWRIAEISGATAHPMYSLGKLMWLKAHEPGLYAGVRHFLPYSAFVLWKMGARPHMDYSLAARTMAFDIADKRWSGVILDAAGIDAEKLGDPVQAGTAVGEIVPSVADELGLPRGMLLVAGGHDQPCAAFGAGVVSPGLAVDGLGTVECVTPAFGRPVVTDETIRCGFACVPHVVKDLYVTYAFTFTCGAMLKWYRDSFGQEFVREAERSGVSAYELMIRHASGEPSDVYVLPHFAGAATPYMDTGATGAIVGLGLRAGSAEVIRAILEGITYEMMVNLESLGRSGIDIKELRAVGGLAQSERYLQLKADVMGRKITTLEISEAGTLGVAMLAGMASGEFGSAREAVKRLVRTRREFLPDERLHAVYREKFDTYKRLYPAMKSIFGRT